MRLIDIFRLSTRMFKTNKLRTILTILGISVGIGAILFLVSLGLGLQKVLISQIATSMLSMDVNTIDSKTPIKLNKEHIEKIKSLNGVADMSPVFETSALMKVDDLSGAVFAVLIKKSFFGLEGTKIEKGGFFNNDSDNKIIVSTAALQLFGLGADNAIGKTARFELYMPKKNEKGEFSETEEVEIKNIDKSYEIVGIIDDNTKGYAYVPVDSIQYLEIPFYTWLKLNAKEQKDIPELKKQIEDMGFRPTAVSDTVSDTDRIFQAIQIILSVFGAVALIVSAIGMFNTMTIALLERTQEIGIMKSLGASRQDIWKLFLAESVIIGFLGGLGGIFIGFAGRYAVNAGVNFLASSFGGQQVDLFDTPVAFTIFVIAFSTAVGLLTGLYPAKRASHLNPLEALRYK